jgi:hypothetical protein
MVAVSVFCLSDSIQLLFNILSERLLSGVDLYCKNRLYSIFLYITVIHSVVAGMQKFKCGSAEVLRILKIPLKLFTNVYNSGLFTFAAIQYFSQIRLWHCMQNFLTYKQ